MNAAVSAPRTQAVFPPGPRWLTPLPLARSMQGDILASVGELIAQYGDAVGVRAGPVKMLVLARPEYARHVFIRNANNSSHSRQTFSAIATLLSLLRLNFDQLNRTSFKFWLLRCFIKIRRH